jgi:hypothetical protein
LRWLAARKLAQPRWMAPIRVMIGLVFALMLLVSVTTRHWETGFLSAVAATYILHLLTRTQFALTATRGWHEEKQSGALELLLVTPLREQDLVAAYTASLRRAFRFQRWHIVGLNALLMLVIILFFDRLHMGGGAWAVFSVLLIGGALITWTDFPLLRWLSLREALRQPTQMKAAGMTLTWLAAVPWFAFALALVFALRFNRGEDAALVFALWVACCLAYNWILIRLCRAWIRRGLRVCASV